MEIKPPCQQCLNAGQACYGKMRGPGCWRCSQQKIGCSIVEARKKGKGKEAEVIQVKRAEKRKMEEEVENEEQTDSESETEETAAGEKDGDGEVEEVKPAAFA